MRNPTRRNRNIGTPKQGYGQNNRFKIPIIHDLAFYERLGKYRQEFRYIQEQEFRFVIEETSKNYQHACTVNDVQRILQHINLTNLEHVGLIVFRQPKRKEQVLSAVWGRCIYSFEFEGKYYPAIVIEATDCSKKLKWTKRLKPDGQEELQRLREDGHEIITDKRHHIFNLTLENVRNTQLYRTLLHDMGHHAHYYEKVEAASHEEEDLTLWQKRWEEYCKISSMEKEKYAHQYADRLKKQLIDKGIIPFDSIED